jgi:putative autotransporter adhesin-like protein
MKYSKIILILLILPLFLTNSCNVNSINGSGNIIKNSRSVSGFNRVSISGSGHLFIIQGNKESLTIDCDDNIEPYIFSIVKDKTLKIGPDKFNLNPSEPIKYTLTLRNIRALKTSGSILVKSNTLRTEKLKVEISGSGRFILDRIEAQSITFKINGSGKVDIESGNLQNQILSISGSGEFNLPNLKSENTDLNISGSGKAKVWVTNKLNIKISGNGKAYYYGTPIISSTISGSGKVDSLGTK